MTDNELLTTILRQSGDTPDGYRITDVQRRADGVALVTFTAPSVGAQAAVVYPDGTCFSKYDWQQPGAPPTFSEIPGFEWVDHEHGTRGILLNGLPRKLR